MLLESKKNPHRCDIGMNKNVYSDDFINGLLQM